MPADLQAILKLQVPVIVQIGQRTMPVADVVSIAPGAIIELPKPADEELDLLVNNKPIGSGTAVKVGENFGLRVTFVGNLAQRVSAFGAAAATAQPSPEGGQAAGAPPAGANPVAAIPGGASPAAGESAATDARNTNKAA